MKAHKALRAILFTFILTVGFLLATLTSTPVLAESSTGQTTLYFTDALNFEENENFSEFGFAFMGETPSTKQNDSQYPPSLFIKNTSKFLPRYSFNADQWLTWFSTTWLLYFIKNSPEFNFTDLLPGFELFLPHPFRVVEGYTYNGNDSVNINGDLVYDLYFTSPIKKQKFRDDVKVELYSMSMNSALPLPKLIKNTTNELTPGLFSDIYNQKITLKNISHTLEPGDSLLFTIEIVPSNKTLPTLITKYIDLNRFISRWEERANRWENRSNMHRLQDIGTALKDILSILKESSMNITSEDFAAIINAMRSTSFIYDSANHPASVTIPAKISEEDIRVYYLHTIP